MTVRFYSHLDLVHCLLLLFRTRSGGKTYYFDASRPAKTMLAVIGGMLNVSPFTFRLAEIRDASGQHAFPKLYGADLINICNTLEQEVYHEDPFLRKLAGLFPSDGASGISLFLRKITANKLRDAVVFLHVIAWHGSRSKESEDADYELSVERSLFSGILIRFARSEFDLSVTTRFSISAAFRSLIRLIGAIALSVGAILRSCILALRSISRASEQKTGRPPIIASPYQMKGLTFDASQRCDFPWLLTPGMPRDRVMIIFERPEHPLNEETAAILKQHGVGFVALTPGAAAGPVPVFRPGSRFALHLAGLLIRLLLAAIRALFTADHRTLQFLPEAVWFTKTYAEAFELYRTHGIRIIVDHVDSDPYRVARHLALSAQGGISASYQVSNWPIPNIVLGSHADVMFLFGPYYKDKLLRSGSKNRSIVISGYFSDSAFQPAKSLAAKMRKQLADHGATFVVCYFDENSSDDRMSLIPNSRSALVYRKLLEWVMSDKTAGLICSPKRPKTLFTRLPEIAQLVDAAQATGRCLFLDGDYCAANYPTEAAQASDVVVSLLIGGTTSLESLLSGTRILYLDLEGLYSYPEYQWGRNSIVFDDVDRLLSVISTMQNHEESFNHDRNEHLTATLQLKDPFRDGKSSERMSEYLRLLLEACERGDGKLDAINHADRKYAEHFGAENVLGTC